jgi:hypothetical protein
MIYQTVSEADFISAFKLIRHGQFSYEGLKALYEYLDELYQDEYYNLDAIAICCDFTEYENFEEIKKDYSDISSIDELLGKTTLIPVGDQGYLVQAF